ncbi:TetR/AcrR family transcriptional regulator [Ferrovibrio sp.]|uniref:TetR/AcrR family transcriptional regulator n=1 Tax=Ferrovibrio sp. TaxID=1917215 RepID=UPI00351752C7
MARPKAFDTSAALLQAMELFWEQGYAATSVDQLVAAMGISRQSLYDTYGDKHALFLAALDAYCAMLEDAMLAPLKQPGAGLQALHDTAVGVVDFLIRYPKRRACLMANTTLELAPHDAAVAAKVRRHLANMEAAFRLVLDHARARGEIAAGADPDALARYLVGMIHGVMVLAKSGADRDTLLGIVATAAGMLQPAIPVSVPAVQT